MREIKRGHEESLLGETETCQRQNLRKLRVPPGFGVRQCSLRCAGPNLKRQEHSKTLSRDRALSRFKIGPARLPEDAYCCGSPYVDFYNDRVGFCFRLPPIFGSVGAQAEGPRAGPACVSAYAKA